MGFQISKVLNAEKLITLYPWQSKKNEKGEELNPIPQIVDASIREVGLVMVYPSIKVIDHLDRLNPTKFMREGDSISFIFTGENSATAKYMCYSLIKDWVGVEDENGVPKPYNADELYDLFDRVPALYVRLYIAYKNYSSAVIEEEKAKKEDFFGR